MTNQSKVLGATAIAGVIHGKIKAIEAACQKGLKRSGVLLQRQSMLLVPVDFGPLKASAFTRAEGKGFKTVVTVGYTKSYAPMVHERVAMAWKGLPRHKPSKGKYWDPQGRATAKFLEKPARAFLPMFNAVMTEEIQKAVNTTTPPA